PSLFPSLQPLTHSQLVSQPWRAIAVETHTLNWRPIAEHQRLWISQNGKCFARAGTRTHPSKPQSHARRQHRLDHLANGASIEALLIRAGGNFDEQLRSRSRAQLLTGTGGAQSGTPQHEVRVKLGNALRGSGEQGRQPRADG